MTAVADEPVTSVGEAAADDLGAAEAELRRLEREAADAQALEAELERRIADNEPVTAEEYQGQRDLVRFSKLRVKAIRDRIARIRADAVERERQAAVAEILQAVGDGSLDELTEIYSRAHAAMADLVKAVDARAAAMEKARKRMYAVGFGEMPETSPKGWGEGGRGTFAGWGRTEPLVIRGQRIPYVSAADLLRRLTWAVAQDTGALDIPHSGRLAVVQLDSPPRYTADIETRAKSSRSLERPDGGA